MMATAELRIFGPSDWLLDIRWPNGARRLIGSAKLFGLCDWQFKVRAQP